MWLWGVGVGFVGVWVRARLDVSCQLRVKVVRFVCVNQHHIRWQADGMGSSRYQQQQQAFGCCRAAGSRVLWQCWQTMTTVCVARSGPSVAVMQSNHQVAHKADIREGAMLEVLWICQAHSLGYL